MAYDDAPEAVPNYATLEVVPQSEKELARQRFLGSPQSTSIEKTSPGKRSSGVPVTTFWVVTILLFLIGGGIGAGVAIAATKKKWSTQATQTNGTLSTATVTTTISAATATSTITTNVAGCPVSNLTTYTSSISSAKFIIRCDTDLLFVSNADPNLNAPGTLATSVHACLDLCASFNANSTKVTAAASSCMGATWVMNSINTERNLMCFLKRTGSVAAGPNGQEMVSGFLT